VGMAVRTCPCFATGRRVRVGIPSLRMGEAPDAPARLRSESSISLPLETYVGAPATYGAIAFRQADVPPVGDRLSSCDSEDAPGFLHPQTRRVTLGAANGYGS